MPGQSELQTQCTVLLYLDCFRNEKNGVLGHKFCTVKAILGRGQPGLMINFVMNHGDKKKRKNLMTNLIN